MVEMETIYIVLLLGVIFSVLFGVIVWACCGYDRPETSNEEKSEEKCNHPPKTEQLSVTKQHVKQEEITASHTMLQKLSTETNTSSSLKISSLETLMASILSSMNIAVSMAPYLAETVNEHLKCVYQGSSGLVNEINNVKNREQLESLTKNVTHKYGNIKSKNQNVYHANTHVNMDILGEQYV
ncbi:uncharacterized protein LOC143247299 [Tachypleus tridentatus]|uniref:uncharacterized protein LOC143247299 n=1 Tax=Tachypleus tridentatus TaxID=6853 RepID=UPI003FD312B4